MEAALWGYIASDTCIIIYLSLIILVKPGHVALHKSPDTTKKILSYAQYNLIGFRADYCANHS